MALPPYGDPMQALDRLAEIAGIHASYWDIAGTCHVTPEKTKRAILTAMGIPAATDAEVTRSLRIAAERPWRELLPPVLVMRRGRAAALAVEIALPDDLAFSRLDWRLALETGETIEGRVAACDLPVVAAADLGGRTVTRRRLEIHAEVPDGYHDLAVAFAGHHAHCRVVMAPDRAFVPEWMERGERRWGLSCQVYALRGAADWGIGDFSSLSEFAASGEALGASLIGINPLHALFPVWPDACSPYSPSSRQFLNPLAIAVERISFADESPRLAALRADPEFAATLAAAKTGAFVDYPTVADLKLRAMFALYEDFLELPPERTAAFDDFCAAGGDALRRFCEFSALHETMGGLPWHTWPAPLQDPDSPEVEAYALANAERVTFHAFLQYAAEAQLARVAAAHPDAGLYRDLAVGANADGADAWANRHDVIRGMSFGAPPDAFSAIGQDWGLPPPHPLRMRDTAYAGFIAMVRANMRHARALRLDHVMGLMRLFWIPAGHCALEGAYVSYPFEDLLGVIALESHRNRCLVVGEDLGTVPEDFRRRMAEERLLSYRVVYFERWPSGLFKRPEVYPPLALVTATTHDMPTIAGHWLGRDIDMREQAGVFGGAENTAAERAAREIERRALAAALLDQDLAPVVLPAETEAAAEADALADLTDAVERFAARTPSRLLMVNPGDLLRETTQINLPGTVDEHPNWRRRMTVEAAKLATHPAMREGIAGIQEERPPVKRPG